ncbi:hypothetical protein ES707_11033 [subsurface metagenome]
MTKGEVLEIIRNHKGEIASALNNTEIIINSLVLGQVPEGHQRLIALSTIHMTDFAEVKLAEMVDAINQWPEE